MMFDGNCTISNEKRGRYDVTHYGSVTILHSSFWDVFAVNASIDRYKITPLFTIGGSLDLIV